MDYVTLGSTGPTVSRIGFGCGDRAGLFVRGSPEVRAEAVDKALEGGITYFDTAAKYGDGASEANLGSILAARDVDVVVGTKVALKEADLNNVGPAIRRSVERSLSRLRIERIGLYQLHNRLDLTEEHAAAARRSRRYPDGGTPILTLGRMLDPGGVLETLADLKQDGKVGALGLTTFGGNPEAVREIVATGVFDAVNCSLHLLNPSAVVRPRGAWPAVDYGGIGRYASEAGLGVLAIRALAGGRLTGSPEPHPNARQAGGGDGDVMQDHRVASRLDAWLHRTGESLPRAALMFTLAWSTVSTVVCGFSGPGHIDDALDALDAVRHAGIAEATAREWVTDMMGALAEEQG